MYGNRASDEKAKKQKMQCASCTTLHPCSDMVMKRCMEILDPKGTKRLEALVEQRRRRST